MSAAETDRVTAAPFDDAGVLFARRFRTNPSMHPKGRALRSREPERRDMEATEIQARATIAAALITSRAVEVPRIPTSGDWSKDSSALRLRDLTDYVYQMITSPRSR